MTSSFAIIPDRVRGGIYGLAMGDVFGAPYEGGPLERLAWRIIGRRRGRHRWTDDTQMSLDVLESLLERGEVDQDDLARRFAASYRWSRGYGPGAAKILKRIRGGVPWREANRSVYPEGSFGNGGAMRSPVVGLYFANRSDEEILRAAEEVAIITHAHPLALEGARHIALATAMAARGADKLEIVSRLIECALSEEFATQLQTTGQWLRFGREAELRDIRENFGNGVAANRSVVTAIYLALAHRDSEFEELLLQAVRLRGDVDTIAAMAGAIWGAGAGYEALPALNNLKDIDQIERIDEAADRLGNRFAQKRDDEMAALREEIISSL